MSVTAPSTALHDRAAGCHGQGKIGRKSWRVCYRRPDCTVRSISGFDGAKAAGDYADDMESGQRRGLWLDRDSPKMTVAAWAGVWVKPWSGDPHTEENYRRCPQWGRMCNRR